MDWRSFNDAAMYRLRRRLERDTRFYESVITFYRRLGRGPADPVIIEARKCVNQILDLADLAGRERKGFAPYRPYEDPWKTSGLRAVLKGGFAERGITEVQRPAGPE